MGALHAWRRSSNWNESMVNFRSCDLVRVRLRRGWIDAHEVTVARYRAWVRAGQPLPPTQSAVRIRAWSGTGDRFVLGTRPYVGSWDVSVTFGDFSLGEGSCTWRDTPGSTEDRPINCISSAQAVAFCYWDGRHVATDAAWEYAARNSTTTDFPTGSLPEPTAFCAIPGVGMVGGACPPTLLPPPIGSYAMGATRNPAGVEELTGGVSEYLARIYPFMLSSERPNQCTIPVDPKNGRVIVPDEFDAAVGPGFVRGLNFALREREARMLVSPSSIVEESGFGPRVGFRCARWAEEP
jgi:formylglycine-generating enzyme required for sulfatase activity